MKTHAQTFAVALVLLLTLTVPPPPPARAATFTVRDCTDPGGPNSLRSAITNANPGDTITWITPCMTTVAPATPLTIAKNLTIIGLGPQKTIIDGGGITQIFEINGGNVAISNLTLRNGKGSLGGAIFSFTGSLTLTNSIVTNNTADQGGGLDTQGTLTLLNSTVSNNTSLNEGGGIAVTAGATVINSTISGNSAAISGGGILAFNSGTVTVTNSTINNNSSGLLGGGGIFAGVTVTLKNTILANNTAPTATNCSFFGGGSIVSNGNNLESANTCGFNPSFDLINTNPMLGPLQLNGGPTPTHALLPGSPAIDAGDNLGCTPTDQRGVPRPLDATSPGFTVCDIGAFEVETLGFIHASLSLNTATVHPGTPVQGTVTVSNVGGARPLDVYVAVVPPAAGPGLGCPSGDAVAFLTSSGASLTCVSSGVQTFAPLLTNVSLPADLFTPVPAPLFSLVWPAGAPLGSYTVAFVLTPVGAFTDGRVNPTAGIVLATAGFSATP